MGIFRWGGGQMPPQMKPCHPKVAVPTEYWAQEWGSATGLPAGAQQGSQAAKWVWADVGSAADTTTAGGSSGEGTRDWTNGQVTSRWLVCFLHVLITWGVGFSSVLFCSYCLIALCNWKWSNHVPYIHVYRPVVFLKYVDEVYHTEIKGTKIIWINLHLRALHASPAPPWPWFFLWQPLQVCEHSLPPLTQCALGERQRAVPAILTLAMSWFDPGPSNTLWEPFLKLLNPINHHYTFY